MALLVNQNGNGKNLATMSLLTHSFACFFGQKCNCYRKNHFIPVDIVEYSAWGVTLLLAEL